jgi:hypothetical protein
MITEIRRATTATDHHGKYKHDKKLKSMIKIVETINFIFVI